MKQVIVERFGGPEELQVRELPTPEPAAGEVRVKITSIGMNHAELMARRGEYKLASGEPPFTPGLEAGGLIEAVGQGVDQARIGQRVTLHPQAPRLGGPGGTYRSHYLLPASEALPAPDAIADEALGALWLSHLTAWGCLIWKQQLQQGQFVAIPAASSSVGLAASQIVKQADGIAIGLTTSPGKAGALDSLDAAMFDHVVVTHQPDGTMNPWHRQIKSITRGHGIDVFFDPVAAGEYLNTEIRCLAQDGTIWIYGLLGQPGTVDVTPLIRKNAAIRGWVLNQILADADACKAGCEAVMQGFASGAYKQHIAEIFPLNEVQHAHEVMEQGNHIGKLILRP